MFKLRAVNRNNELIIEQNFNTYEEATVKAKEFNKMGHLVYLYNERQLKAIDNKSDSSYMKPGGIVS